MIRPIRIANDVFSNGLFSRFAVSKENEGILESIYEQKTWTM